MASKGIEIETIQVDPTDKALANRYENEIHSLKQMHENKTGIMEEEKLTKDEEVCRTGAIMALMYLASVHKKALLDLDIKINQLRLKKLVQVEEKEKEEERNKEERKKEEQKGNSEKEESDTEINKDDQELFNRIAPRQSKTTTEYDLKISAINKNKEKQSKSLIQKQELMDKVSNDMDNIIAVQNSMQELSDLMTNFSQKVVEQDEVAATILHDAEEANVNIKQAGKELKQANEYQKGTGTLVAMIYIIMSILLLIYDRVTAIHYYY